MEQRTRHATRPGPDPDDVQRLLHDIEEVEDRLREQSGEDEPRFKDPGIHDGPGTDQNAP